jgi:hypothetical protein
MGDRERIAKSLDELDGTEKTRAMKEINSGQLSTETRAALDPVGLKDVSDDTIIEVTKTRHN